MYVCEALLWLSICVLLCIVNTNEYYMFCLMPARVLDWKIKHFLIYSILFIHIGMIYVGIDGEERAGCFA